LLGRIATVLVLKGVVNNHGTGIAVPQMDKRIALANGNIQGGIEPRKHLERIITVVPSDADISVNPQFVVVERLSF